MSTLAQGNKINNRYTLLSFIGNGSFGEVWLAHDDIIDTDVALKIYVSLNPAGISQFTKEYKTTANLSHPNLLTAKHFDVWERRPFLEMKYCGKGSADKLVGNITEKHLWHFIHDVAAGLHYLHDLPEPIIHQDIKPDNVLMDDDGMFLITDFGISKQLRATIRKQSGRSDASGSCAYMGPERFNADPTPIKASDIWSLGASIYELAKGELPFYGQGGVMLKNGADLPELGAGWSSELNQTIQACLAKDPWNRPTAEQLEKYAESMLQSLESGRPVATALWIKPKKTEPIIIPSAGNATMPIGKQETPKGTYPTTGDANTSSNKWLWSLLILPLLILGIWGIVYKINKDKELAVKGISGYENGYAYVDLGLPSGTLWATCNVGANRPEEYGNYYAWGETLPKKTYTWETYKYGKFDNGDTRNYGMNKYNKSDGKTTLDLSDDAARVNWGGNWRIPTKAEQDELRTKCTWTWTALNGVNGYKIIGPNGMSIFLPAAGIRDESNLAVVGLAGHYCSSSLNCDHLVLGLGLDSDGHGRTDLLGRCLGFSVRPVLSPQ